MKKSLTFVAILLLFITLLAIKNTYSLFESNGDGIVSENLAKWQIKVGDTYLTTLSKEDEEFNLDNITWSNGTHVKDGKGTPGAKGSFEIVIDPLKTETSFLYYITIDMDSLNNSAITLESVSEKNGYEFIKQDENTYVGLAKLSDIKKKNKYYIDVNLVWNDIDNNNLSDYELGSKTNTVKLPIHIKTIQYDGTENIDFS